MATVCSEEKESEKIQMTVNTNCRTDLPAITITQEITRLEARLAVAREYDTEVVRLTELRDVVRKTQALKMRLRKIRDAWLEKDYRNSDAIRRTLAKAGWLT